MTDVTVPLRELLEQRMDAQDQKLDEILEQVRLTNGRVDSHDVQIAVLKVGYGIGAVLGAAGAYWLFSKLP